MALLKRELHREIKGSKVTHADRWTLVFDTDSKSLYVECEAAHFGANTGGTVVLLWTAAAGARLKAKASPPMR